MRAPVIINGGGIGGLATALAFHAKNLVPDLHINILERNPRPNAYVGRGAGLNLQPHAVKVLHELGLMEEVVASGWVPMNQQYFTNDGRTIANSPRGLNADPNGYPQVSIHRSTLHGILERAVEERLGPDTIKRGIQGVSYNQDEGGVCLHCKDVDENLVKIHCDAVIGADGIHSGMRQAMLRARGKPEPGPIKSGINVYRGTALVDKVLDGHTVVLAGHSQGKLVCYPLEAPKLVLNPDGSMGQKQLLNFVVEVAEESSPSGAFSSQDDLADYVASKLEHLNGGFRLPFLDHRKMLREADDLKAFPMSDRNPLETWRDGRVVLLGDAAHPMYPVGSNGASSALLDAAEMASTLEKNLKKKTHVRHYDICKSFQEYEEARLASVTSVQGACRAMLPEKVMDRVHHEAPREDPVPESYEASLLQALSKCQAGKKVDEIACRSDKLTTPAAFANQNLVSNFSPMERILLAANGSLQRTMSAISNSDVVVQPVMTSPRNGQFLDREVRLHLESVDGPCVANCKTTVVPRNDNMRARMLSQEVGIGQLLTEFRKAGKEEPDFKLLGCGKKQEGILTRQYYLDIPDEVTFFIQEEVDLGVLKIGGHEIRNGMGCSRSSHVPETSLLIEPHHIHKMTSLTMASSVHNMTAA